MIRNKVILNGSNFGINWVENVDEISVRFLKFTEPLEASWSEVIENEEVFVVSGVNCDLCWWWMGTTTNQQPMSNGTGYQELYCHWKWQRYWICKTKISKLQK